MITFRYIERFIKTLLIFCTACAGYAAAQTNQKMIVLDTRLYTMTNTMTIQGCLLQLNVIFDNKDSITQEASLKNMQCVAFQRTYSDGIKNYIECKPTDISSEKAWALQRNYRSGSELPTKMFLGRTVDTSGEGPLEPFATAAAKVNDLAKKCDAVKRINYEDMTDPLNPMADREYVAKMDSSNAALTAKDRKVWLQQLQKRVDDFRKNLKVGDDSSCGLVIDVKAPIISVQTQTGVQWLKIAQLYPAGMSCQFVNGVYQPQSMPVN